jgi:hypothetical protein
MRVWGRGARGAAAERQVVRQTRLVTGVVESGCVGVEERRRQAGADVVGRPERFRRECGGACFLPTTGSAKVQAA